MHSNLIAATRPDRELKGMEEKKRSYPDIVGRKMKCISFFNYSRVPAAHSRPKIPKVPPRAFFLLDLCMARTLSKNLASVHAL